MYNETRKENFISAYTQNSTTAINVRSMLSAFQPFEERLGKDLCEFTSDEATAAFQERFGANTASSEYNVLYLVKQYIRWCRKEGFSVKDGLENEIVIKNPGSRRSKYVASPAHLQMALDTMFKPESEKTVGALYRAWCWLWFSGFPLLKDAADHITASNFNLDKMTFEYGGFTYKLPFESKQCIEDGIHLTEFKYYHPLYEPTVLPRKESDLFFRSARNRICGSPIMIGVLAKAQNETDFKLTPLSIRKSGLFYRVYEKERIGIKDALSDELYKYVAANVHHEIPREVYLNNKAYKTEKSNITKEYNAWKYLFT